jgi:alkylation response protein AidB-like acyl-CoA dehydrogenase
MSAGMMDAADLELFAQTVRQANEARSGSALDAALVEVGWHDALAADPHAAISVQFEHQGRGGATSSALEHVVAHALGVDEPAAVVLPALGTWSPPGRLDGDAIVVDGLVSAGFAAHGQALIAVAGGDQVVRAVIPTDALTIDARDGIDPGLGLSVVSGVVPVGAPDRDPALPMLVAEPAGWDAAVDLARLAISHELVGVSRTMLDQARTHALERVQFGQPIAGFQAVRHRLAESLVAIEAAEAMVGAAWLEGTPQAIAMAKALAGRSARTVAKHSQQVLAGIGFTTEHPFHTCFRRVLVLDQLFGSARTLTTALGRDVLERRELPPLLPL